VSSEGPDWQPPTVTTSTSAATIFFFTACDWQSVIKTTNRSANASHPAKAGEFNGGNSFSGVTASN
jgi:hypothetical protein